MALYLKRIQKLHFAQLLTVQEIGPDDHYSELRWLPICFWAQFKVLGWTYQVLYILGLGYLTDRLLLSHCSHISGRRALHPRMVCAGESACSVVVPQLWNALPPKVCRGAPHWAFSDRWLE